MAKNWQAQLLSSGFPLEYAVQNLLITEGFNVDGEIPYTRLAEHLKEFSVDIAADYFIPDPNDKGGLRGTLQVLCECKYRRAQKAWLFIPDLNEPDFSPSRFGAIRTFEQFTAFSYEREPIRHFVSQIPNVLKGVEVMLDGGESHDADIKHAINQLRYCLPQTIAKEVRNAISSHADDALPFFVLPLLVTNAPIYVLKAGLKLSDFEQAADLATLCESAGSVDLHSPHSEDFTAHCGGVFKAVMNEDGAIRGRTLLKELDHYFKSQGHTRYTASNDILAFCKGQGNTGGCFTQFLVVNFAALPTFLRELKSVLDESLAGTKQVVFSSDLA